MFRSISPAHQRASERTRRHHLAIVGVPTSSRTGGTGHSVLAFEGAPAHDVVMNERVFEWSRGRRVRIVVADVPGDYERLLESVTSDARHIDDSELLADDVSAVFGTHVRLERREMDGCRGARHQGRLAATAGRLAPSAYPSSRTTSCPLRRSQRRRATST